MATVPYQEEVVGLVEGKVNDINDILDTKLVTLDEFIDDLEAAMDFTVPLSGLTFSVPDLVLEDLNLPNLPTRPTLNTDFGIVYPASVTPQDITITTTPAPSIDTTPPVIPDRSAPTIPDRTLAATEPSIRTDISPATMRAFTMPTVPAVNFKTIRDFDGFQLPQFDASEPLDVLEGISTQYQYTDPTYSSTLAPKVQAWLEGIIDNGGTGLDAEIETAIFENVKSRLDAEYEEQYRKVERYHSSRGLRRPPGALNGDLARVNAEYNRRLDEQNNAIAIKQAELAQTNTHFALQQAVGYENILRNFHGQMASRILQSAKDAVETALGIYRAKLERWNSLWKAFEIKAGIYELKIRAMQILAEEYKTELQAIQIADQRELIKEQIYKDQLSAIELLVQIYKAENDGTMTALAVEKNKIDLFREQIAAFVATLQGDQTKLAVFNSQLQGDQTKALIYSEKMKGYGLLAGAVDSQNRVAIEKAKLEDQILNMERIEILKAELARVDSQIKNNIAIEKLKTDIYQTDGAVYESGVRASSIKGTLQIEQYKAEMQYAVAQIQMILKEAELNQQASVQENQLKLKSLEAMVNALTQLIASAMSAVHASMQLGYSGGYNANIAYQPDVHVSEVHEYRDYCDPSCSG